MKILLLFIISVAAKRFPVYTENSFRSSFQPNTIREDFPGLIPPWRQFDESNEKNNIYYDNYCGETTTYRCPRGWQGVGHFCATVSLVKPYTQCPHDRCEFFAGVGNPLIPHPAHPGICNIVEFHGVELTCPEDFALEGFMCKGARTAIPSSVESNQCPLTAGHCDHEDHIGCNTEHITIPPLPSCNRLTLSSYVDDAWAWWGRQRLVCQSQKLIKGRLVCPPGYTLTGELYPEYAFGDIIDLPAPPNAPSATDIVFSKETRLMLESGFLNHLKLTVIDDVLCQMALVIPAKDCTAVSCPLPDKLKKDLTHWSFKIQSDPEYLIAKALPHGDDSYTTQAGWAKKTGLAA